MASKYAYAREKGWIVKKDSSGQIIAFEKGNKLMWWYQEIRNWICAEWINNYLTNHRYYQSLITAIDIES